MNISDVNKVRPLPASPYRKVATLQGWPTCDAQRAFVMLADLVPRELGR